MLVPGNHKFLWNVGNMAKDININEIRPGMKIGCVKVSYSDLAETFAEYFVTKDKNITQLLQGR